MLNKARLSLIVLCQGLSLNRQQRAAVCDFSQHTLYLDVSRGSYDPDYVRKGLHHEFFHIIDNFDDGAIYEDHPWSLCFKLLI